MRRIQGLLSGVWQATRIYALVFAGGWGRPRLYVFLLTLFLLVGVVLVLIGVDLEDADRWLDRQGGWLAALGSAALRVVFGLVLLGCAVAVLAGLYQRLPGRRQVPVWDGRKERRRTQSRQGDGRIGWGMMILALVIGYFAFIGTFGRY
ncbi:hypothetical protein FHP25_27390 [Vineibacter terrae]|uniref:Uncharacterized protein n=1 Tax=Vineibacter terrae TaxID=2586908 RepID=A0A5C8PE97_9HYPH|nr:hypothetical protein [Vineibacter terrae]TXL71963.1 hypothetical protein FHP25_27390 [Vineibacter terrae]